MIRALTSPARLALTCVAMLSVGSAKVIAQANRTDTLRLTLSDGIAIAIRQATQVQTARADQRVAGAQVLAAYGRFLPAAGVGASVYGEQGTALLSSTALAPYDASLRGAQLGLSAGITIFDGLRDQAGLRAALAQQSATGLTLVRARQQIANDVTEAFYRVVLDDRLTAVAQSNLALSRQRLAQLDEQVAAGLKAPPDLYRQQALASEDEASVISAQTRRSADRIALLRRLRMDPLQNVNLVAPTDTTLPPGALASFSGNIQALYRTALSQRSDLAAANAQTRAAEEGIRQAHGALLPRVALQFDLVDAGRYFDRQVQGGVDLLSAKNAAVQSGLASQLGHQAAGIVTLGVSVPVFDRWQSHADVERAQAIADISRLREEDLRDRVVGEVAQALDEITSLEQIVKAATAQATAAQKAYDAVSGRYEVGLASFIDVATSQAELTRARSSVEAALVNQAVAREHLTAALGAETAETAAAAGDPAAIRIRR